MEKLVNIIDANDFLELTGISAEEVGEESNSTTIRDNAITKAQIEFFRDAGRTFVSTDSDYTIAQEAVAFLAAHKIATHKMALVGEETRISPYYEEYKRLLRLVSKGTTSTSEGIAFQGGASSVTSQEDSADYVADMPDE